MSATNRLLAGLVLLGSSVAAPAHAAEVKHVTQYDITLGILPVATASFSSEFNGPDYRITGTFRSAGIASVIKPVSAETNVAGRVQADHLQAERYNLVYKLGKRTRVYDVAYKDGNVTETSITPPPRRRGDNWVPVMPKDLLAVLDPLSGLIFPEAGKVCAGRLPIYDGESRMDLVMQEKGRKPFSTSGYKGDAIVCSVRYVPKSGFRRGRSDIEYLKKTPMEVWFAKAEGANVYAPVYARIPTRMGPLYVTAVRYGG